MANRNFPNGKSIYIPQVKPVLLNCSFVVDSGNTNGLGIRSLTGGYVKNIFMHTSSTPGVGNGGITNPNPAAGTILVQFDDNYNRLLCGFNAFTSPTSGSAVKIDNSALTPGVAYVITTLGDATLAKWRAIGVPVGVTPAVGVAFIAATNGGSGNTLTSRVMTTATGGSGIVSIENVGNANLSISPDPTANQGYGGSLILQCRGLSFSAGSYTPAGTISAPTFTGAALGTHTHSFTPEGTNANDGPPETFTGTPGTTGATSAGTPAGTVSAPTFTGTAASLTGTVTSAIAAPADETVLSLSFYLSDSGVLVAGQ